MKRFYLPPGVFCVVDHPRAVEMLREFICAICADGSKPIAALLAPDVTCERLCLVFDIQEYLKPHGHALLVGEAHVNPRPATFCADCYAWLKADSLARRGRAWESLSPEEQATLGGAA